VARWPRRASLDRWMVGDGFAPASLSMVGGRVQPWVTRPPRPCPLPRPVPNGLLHPAAATAQCHPPALLANSCPMRRCEAACRTPAIIGSCAARAGCDASDPRPLRHLRQNAVPCDTCDNACDTCDTCDGCDDACDTCDSCDSCDTPCDSCDTLRQLRQVATGCDALPQVATGCDTLRHLATPCDALRHLATLATLATVPCDGRDFTTPPLGGSHGVGPGCNGARGARGVHRGRSPRLRRGIGVVVGRRRSTAGLVPSWGEGV
jgi:hypothetical protein